MGTIEYMSPEQKAGGPSDPRNDLFSWGVILYEMLLGKRPTGFVIKWPTEANVSGASPALDSLLQRTLCEAHDRFQTAAEALCALDTLAPPSTPGGRATDPSRRIIWHRLHPKYMEWLLARVSSSEVLLAGERIAVTDVGVLASDGCVSGESPRDGVLLAQVTARGLLVSGHLDILREWLRRTSAKTELGDRAFGKPLRQSLVEGDVDGASTSLKALLEDVDADEHVDRCLFLATVPCRPDDAKHSLGRAEAMAKGPWEWQHCAEGWKGVFGDDASGRRCMQQAESTAKDPLDLPSCAGVWSRAFNDDANARRSLQQAETNATDSGDWLNCARSWKRWLGDDAGARRCLDQAEATASDSADWEWCARSWEEVLTDTARAEQCRQRAKELEERA